mgnify:CR=1 FL=1
MTAQLITVMPTYKFQIEDLESGCLIKDLKSGDLGLLVRRFDLMKMHADEDPIWVWDMHWAGPATDEVNKNIPFIEEAILGLLNGGVWILSGHEYDG